VAYKSDRHLKPSCLADHVRVKRLQENLTMKELALRLGVSHGALKYWEMHKSRPIGRNRQVLVAYLGFDPEVVSQQ
jgi:DNA-binding transcriptional regulator YiaG